MHAGFMMGMLRHMIQHVRIDERLERQEGTGQQEEQEFLSRARQHTFNGTLGLSLHLRR